MFTDDDLKRLKDNAKSLRYLPMQGISGKQFLALLARLEAAEKRDCLWEQCDHESCDTWRKAAGKEQK